MRIAIIGAGMAGLSCADALAASGHDVVLFDKGRGPGGRMSTRRIDSPAGPVSIDHGAQYFTARDKGFRVQVLRWVLQGHVEPWPLPAEDGWIGAPAMNSVIKAMASQHRVHWDCAIVRIDRTAEGWVLESPNERFGGFDTLLLAVPAEQATPFLALNDFAMARQSMLARSQPCWTAMFVFSAQAAPQGDLIRDVGLIGWAARTGAKPRRRSADPESESAPESWVVQATSAWSHAHLDDGEASVTVALYDALADALGQSLPLPLVATAHRWRYAMSGGLGLGSLWNADLRLGACGDWLLGPRVECAWLSGQHLARQAVEAMQEV